MSGAFSALGLYLSYYVYNKTGNKGLTSGVFFFFTMEFLQFIQYFFINQCDNTVNQVLTILGFLHICLQPYFTHVINSSLTRSKTKLAQWAIIHKLALMGGGLLFLRWVATFLDGQTNDVNGTQLIASGQCPSTEWLRGDKLCTMKGLYHLKWAVPMVDATYLPWQPGIAIHSFLMFAPFFAMDRCWIQGLFLYATGPLLGAFITPDLQEQASIWCFFSIAQIALMVLAIRNVFVLKKGEKKAKSISIGGAKSDGKKAK